MPHTHSNHQGHHHTGHQHHVGHHEVKRGMENKTILWTVGIILVVVIAGIIIFISIKGGIGNLGQAKPDPIAEQCVFACDSGQKIAFCDVERKAGINVIATCNTLATDSQYSQYNVQTCPSISCVITAEELDKTCVTGLNSVWATPTAEDTCPAQEGKSARKRTPSDSPTIEGQICCYYY